MLRLPRRPPNPANALAARHGRRTGSEALVSACSLDGRPVPFRPPGPGGAGTGAISARRLALERVNQGALIGRTVRVT
jgi:hypothetical protein